MTIATRVFFAACFMLIGSAAHADLILGVWDATRASAAANGIDGTLSDQARASRAAHFPYLHAVGTDTLTDAFLAGVDILHIHDARDINNPIDPVLSAAEQQALYNFVLQGKNALILADGFFPTAAQSLITPFGMQISTMSVSGKDNNIVTGLTHPIMNGPYGQVNTVTMNVMGYFTELGPYAHSVANLAGNGQPSIAVIESGAIGPNSGRVIITSDASIFGDHDTSTSNGQFTLNETFYLNSVNWLVPEPSSIALGAMGLFALAAVGWRRVGRKSSTPTVPARLGPG